MKQGCNRRWPRACIPRGVVGKDLNVNVRKALLHLCRVQTWRQHQGCEILSALNRRDDIQVASLREDSNRRMFRTAILLGTSCLTTGHDHICQRSQLAKQQAVQLRRNIDATAGFAERVASRIDGEVDSPAVADSIFLCDSPGLVIAGEPLEPLKRWEKANKGQTSFSRI